MKTKYIIFTGDPIYDNKLKVSIDCPTPLMDKEYPNRTIMYRSLKDGCVYVLDPIKDKKKYDKMVENGEMLKPTNYIDPYGIENVCFSLSTHPDSNWEYCKKQRLERGFDTTELWNLHVTIASFIVPRLKAFKEESPCIPGNVTVAEWESDCDKMIEVFQSVIDGTDKYEEVQEGLELFKKYFLGLWW